MLPFVKLATYRNIGNIAAQRRGHRMKDDELLQRYVKVGEAFAVTMKPLVEVVIHDYRRPKHSVIAVFNGHVTGRKVGDPLTTLGADRIAGKGVPDVLVGYAGRSSDGRALKCTSFAIRNDAGRLVGALCMNADISLFQALGEVCRVFSDLAPLPQDTEAEQFYPSLAKRNVRALLQDYLRERSLLGRPLLREQKLAALAHLRDQGAFSQRAAVRTAAEELGVTRQSIHRYLRELSN